MLITSSAALLLVGVTALSGPVGAAPVTADRMAGFPYRHMAVMPGERLLPVPAAAETLWVTVDDGSAVPAHRRSRAVPADGTASRDAAYLDPSRCDTEGGVATVCWRSWQRVGDEVRVWALFRGQSCVLIGSLAGQPTRVDCAGDAVGPTASADRPTDGTHST